MKNLELVEMRSSKDIHRIIIQPHDPEVNNGPVFVPTVVEEVLQTRPDRFLKLSLDIQELKLSVGQIIELLYHDVDGLNYKLGYYKIAKKRFFRDTYGLHRDMTRIDLIWLPSRSDDLSRYTFKIIANDDLTYQFADIYPDGSIDYWYDGRKFRWSGSEFYSDDDNDKLFLTLRPDGDS